MMLQKTLIRNRDMFGLVLDVNYRTIPFFIPSFQDNSEIRRINVRDPVQLSHYLEQKRKSNGAFFGVGGYLENRTIYKTKIFSSNVITGTVGERTIHIGTDVWFTAGTSVIAPLDGKIHSFANNVGEGDYGPTIILEHEVGGVLFYTLYGHLTLDSINSLEQAREVRKGDIIGRIGSPSENGHWPPHLHFQIIGDMCGLEGDFPGVVCEEDLERFKEICPNPNLILQIDGLEYESKQELA